MKFKKLLLILGIIIGLGFVAAGAGGYALYHWASKDLPGFTQITDYKPPLVTTVYARDGRVLGYFSKEKRFLVTLWNMPDRLPKAFLAAEDASFYEHEGVDLMAILRAFVANLRAGSIRQGGSTITQQIIKRLLLTPEKSYTRKIKEAILAYRLEKYLTKDEILTIYLNQIYLGAGAYGVEAASREYFGKHVQDLSLAECAMLAGLPQAPSKYNPYQYFEAATARQRYVLGRMLENGWISRDEYAQAISEPIVLDSMPDPTFATGAYYLEEVRRWLVERFGEKEVYEGGLHVLTAIDLEHQAHAEKALRDGLVASAMRRGWTGPVQHLEPAQYGLYLVEDKFLMDELVPGKRIKVLVTDVQPGAATVRFGEYRGVIPVETMAWCRPPNPELAPEDVDDVTDATTVLKPGDVVWTEIVGMDDATGTPPEETETPADLLGFVWNLSLTREPEVEGALVSLRPDTGEVLALVGGYEFVRSEFNRATQARRQPGSAFKPIVYSAALDNGFTPASIVLDAPVVYTDLETDHRWKPENYESVFYGPTLLRTALAKSRNLVTIRVAQKIGISTVIERAKTMGIESEFPRNLSVALGSAEITPINLCQAYTAFARDGSVVTPRLVLKVDSAWGEELFFSELEVREALSPQTAFVMTGLLKEVVQGGTGWRAKRLGRPIGAKTGTTNDNRDAWFMGFTPYLLTGVYVGFDDNQPMGKYETGSRAASPIWVDYRAQVENSFPYKDFNRPAGVTMVRVDARNGLLAGPGTTESYFLPFIEGTEPSETAEADDQGGMGAPSASGEDLLKQVF